ncbi:envelope protein [Trichinella pseudospiralis]
MFNETFNKNEISSHSAEMNYAYADFMLIFAIVNSTITVFLSALMLHFIYKRNGRRADLVLLKGFSFASMCFAFGSAFSLMRRYFDDSNGAFSLTEAWKCIVLNFYFIPQTFGIDATAMVVLLLSFERLLLLVYLLTGMQLVVYLICSLQQQRNHKIRSQCFFMEVITPRCFLALTILRICFWFFSALFSLFAYMAFIRTRNLKVNSSLKSFQRSHQRSTLRSLSGFILCTVFLQLIPNILLCWKHCFFPITCLFYICVHPDLTGQAKLLLIRVKPLNGRLFTISGKSKGIYLG